MLEELSKMDGSLDGFLNFAGYGSHDENTWIPKMMFLEKVTPFDCLVFSSI